MKKNKRRKTDVIKNQLEESVHVRMETRTKDLGEHTAYQNGHTLSSYMRFLLKREIEDLGGSK